MTTLAVALFSCKSKGITEINPESIASITSEKAGETILTYENLEWSYPGALTFLRNELEGKGFSIDIRNQAWSFMKVYIRVKKDNNLPEEEVYSVLDSSCNGLVEELRASDTDNTSFGPIVHKRVGSTLSSFVEFRKGLDDKEVHGFYGMTVLNHFMITYEVHAFSQEDFESFLNMAISVKER